jgi:hypothetical protein
MNNLVKVVLGPLLVGRSQEMNISQQSRKTVELLVDNQRR